METQQNETLAERRINFFTQKAGKNAAAYQDFLVLIAQPLLFSTDFLYKLWLNFKGYKEKDPKNQPSYLVVSDFILSGLCQPIGTDLFRMEDEIRKHVLCKTTKEIRENVASFIEEYALRNKSNLSKNIFEIHSLFAKGVLHPAEMEKEIIEKLKSNDNPNQKANYLNLYFNSLPFNKDGTQKAGISLVYTDNPNEENVLKLGFLPKGIEGNLERENKKKINFEDDKNLKLTGANLKRLDYSPPKEKLDSIEIVNSTIENVSIYSDVDKITIVGSTIKNLILDYHSSEKITIENCKIENCKINILEIDNLLIINTKIESLVIDVTRIYEAKFMKSDFIIFSFLEVEIIKLSIEDYPIYNSDDLFIGINGINSLTLINNHLKSIPFLRKYKNSLIHLVIERNDIQDISVLRNLKLLTLSLNENSIENISYLSDINSIESINLSNNIVSDISPILELPNLKELYLKGNPIENIPKEIYDFDGNCLEGVREYFENTVMGQMDKEFEKFRIDIENDWKKEVENKIQELKEYTKQGSMEKVFDYLDLYFDKNPQVQYTTLKKEFMTVSSSYVTTLERLIVFLNSEIVKEAISFIEQEKAKIELNKSTEMKYYGIEKEMEELKNIRQKRMETLEKEIKEDRQKREIEALKQTLGLLLEKLTFLLQERLKTSNAKLKFNLTKELEKVEEELKNYRQKLEKLERVQSESKLYSSQGFAMMFKNAKKDHYLLFIQEIEHNRKKLSNHERTIFNQLRNNFIHGNTKNRTWRKDFLNFIQVLDIDLDLSPSFLKIVDTFDEELLSEENNSTSAITETYLSKNKIITQLSKRQKHLESIRNKKTKYKIDNIRNKTNRIDMEVVLKDITQFHVLQEIAYEIRKKQKYADKTLFIGFWIDYQMRGTGYWATYNFETSKANLSYKIQGMQVNEEIEVIKTFIKNYTEKETFLGIWIDVWGKNYISIRFEEGRYLQTRHYVNSVLESVLYKENDIFTWENSSNEQAVIQNDKLEFYAENGNRLFDSFTSIFNLPT